MSGSGHRYDYEYLEKEFIEGPLDVSVRRFAEAHGIKAWSSVNVQAGRRRWREKREDFHARLTHRTSDLIIERTAQKAAQIKEDALDVIHAAMFKMAQDLKDRTVTEVFEGVETKRVITGQIVTPSDLAKLIDRVLLLTGQPTQIGEQRSLAFNLTGAPADILREIAELTAGSGTGRESRAALPGARGPGPN
jgi:hypothetical protein